MGYLTRFVRGAHLSPLFALSGNPDEMLEIALLAHLNCCFSSQQTWEYLDFAKEK